MVSVPSDIKDEIEAIKRRDFYNKPYAELYRQIIRLGLASFKNDSSDTLDKNQ